MKRPSFPLWLLRDVPTLLGMLASFWAMIIYAMTHGGRAVFESSTSRRVHDQMALLLAYAEAKLDLALWRQAYRRLGWNPALIKLHIIPPTTRAAETAERFDHFSRAFRNMNSVVDAYVEQLRQRYNISERELVAHGSTDARLRRAAHHELVGVASLTRATSPFALILSSTRSVRPSKDARGNTHARGPPPRPTSRNQNPPHLARPTRETAPPRPPQKSAFVSGVSTRYAIPPRCQRPSPTLLFAAN